MSMQNNNPFTPAYGQVPAYWAGRKDIFRLVENALEANYLNPYSLSIFVGPRGMGKTVLLRYFEAYANRHGWVTASFNAQSNIMQVIYDHLQSKHQEIKPSSQTKISGVSIAGVGSLSFSEERESTTFEFKTEQVMRSICDHGYGVMILVDEVDVGFSELKSIFAIVQKLIGENKRVALMLAGLPNKVDAILKSSESSYLRRAIQQHISNVSHEEAKAAFREAFVTNEVTIDDDSLELLAHESLGYPFLIQMMGFWAWECAEVTDDGARNVQKETVQTAIAMAKDIFYTSVLALTISELSEKDIAFLVAMAQGADTLSDVAAYMNIKSNAASVYSKRLIDAGVIERDLLGHMRFSIPFLGEFIQDKLMSDNL